MSEYKNLGVVSDKVFGMVCKDMTISFTGEDGRHYKIVIPKSDVKINRNRNVITSPIKAWTVLDSFDIGINIMPNPENENDAMLKLTLED